MSLNQGKSPSISTRTLKHPHLETRLHVCSHGFSLYNQRICTSPTSRATLRHLSIHSYFAHCLQPHDIPQFFFDFSHYISDDKRTVDVVKTQMTFNILCDCGAFEWAGDGLHSVYVSRIHVLNERDDLSIGEYTCCCEDAS